MIVTPVILCGGVGTRLWPLSRAEFPKQFLALYQGKSLFQLAAELAANIPSKSIELSRSLVITSEKYRSLAHDQLAALGHVTASILLEPVPRNTAPALTLAALKAIENGADPILVVMSADQIIVDSASFYNVLKTAIRSAESNSILVLGIEPDSPETGYSYIKIKHMQHAQININDVFDVSCFVEKPDFMTAQSCLKEGNYYWNSGILVIRASIWLESLYQLRPDIAEAVNLAWNAKSDDGYFECPDKILFQKIPDVTIDSAVLEPISRQLDIEESGINGLKMIDLTAAGWKDLGAWDAIWEEGEQDANSNVICGDAIVYDVKESLIHTSNRLVGVVGVENIVVIETSDAVLVMDKNKSQNLKDLVAVLAKNSRVEHIRHRKMYYPWGWSDLIEESDLCIVEHIQVMPNFSVKMLKNMHCSESYIVVRGDAELICGNNAIFLTENQSVGIPACDVYSLVNSSVAPLEVIKVQSCRVLCYKEGCRI
jgi:mannose-1-phosphate guanylyltransferase/mannose-6-phosphate isomerase